MRVSADNPRALLKALCFGGMAREKKVKMVDFVKNGIFFKNIKNTYIHTFFKVVYQYISIFE